MRHTLDHSNARASRNRLRLLSGSRAAYYFYDYSPETNETTP
jgi:hypothetical protein